MSTNSQIAFAPLGKTVVIPAAASAPTGVQALVDATDARLSTHEEVCAIRYEQINARLKRIEGIMIKTAGLMLMSMAGTIFAAMWVVK